ncbi:hypothetical protein V7O62_05675 [Methanolobus sp. ZRKC2]
MVSSSFSGHIILFIILTFVILAAGCATDNNNESPENSDGLANE